MIRRTCAHGPPAWSMILGLGFCAGLAHASTSLGPRDVLLLVNADSPVSIATAHLYRSFHPEVPYDQVLYLHGLPDSASAGAGPASEIITREQFETLIATPLRDYLLSTGKAGSVYCIVTTAGMPYRIEDTDPKHASLVKPAGSDPSLVGRRTRFDAASVESELAVLWQIDPDLPTGTRMPLRNRVVNPYQGYRSGIKSWAAERDMLNRRHSFRWTYPSRVLKGPYIEGEYDSAGYSAANRQMSPADIYLVTRLDGPRAVGYLPIFSVKRMLQRAARVSNPNYVGFVGYNPWTSLTAIDFAPAAPSQYSSGDTYNVPPQFTFLSYADAPVPPGAESFNGYFNSADHFSRSFHWLSGHSPAEGAVSWELIDQGLGGIMAFDATGAVFNQQHLPAGIGLFGLMTYGCNGGDGRPSSYLTTSGPESGQLFHCVPGAVFCSIESFNAVTMFMGFETGQARISEFITIGGSGAIGHCFEPEVGAIVQGEFLLPNLLRDDNLDGVADLCWAEAAFSSLPYLSWSEVVLGDPLMRLRLGAGGFARTIEWPGDANDDGRVDNQDLRIVETSLGRTMGHPRYPVGGDLNEDGTISQADVDEVHANMGRVYE